jgi:hypothetical protein
MIPPSITHDDKLQTQPIFNTKRSSVIIDDTPPRSASDINTPMMVNNVPVRHHQNQHTSRMALYDINNNQQIADVFDTERIQHLSCEHESSNVNIIGRQQLSHVSMISSSPSSNPSSNSSYGSSPCYLSSPKPNPPSLCSTPHLTSNVCQTSESSLDQCSRSRSTRKIGAKQDSFTPDDILSYLDLNEQSEEENISLSNAVSYDIIDSDEPLDFRSV